uniref:Cwf21 domain-containing protein n=1 Tax=Globodera pallida TaxID=36090 RepID=A0A183CAS5_GLOPA
MLSTTFAGIQTMKHEIARLHEAQALIEKELAGKEEKATVQEENPPGGRRHRIDSAWATEIVRDTIEEKRAEDSLIGKKKKALLDEAKRHEKDPLPAERGGPEDDSAEFPKAPRHSFGVGQPVVAAIEQLPTASTATSTTTDTAASTSGVPSSLQRFMALMVLESRQHEENDKEECRRHEQEMERRLVQYGQEATRKK